MLEFDLEIEAAIDTTRQKLIIYQCKHYMTDISYTSKVKNRATTVFLCVLQWVVLG